MESLGTAWNVVPVAVAVAPSATVRPVATPTKIVTTWPKSYQLAEDY
jgi:hypothetical protein